MSTMDVIRDARAEAEDRYQGPRMHHGTVTDREVAAFVAGAGWAAEQRPSVDERVVATVRELARTTPLTHETARVFVEAIMQRPTVEQVADLILTRAVWGGREGTRVGSDARDTEEYLRCQEAGQAVLGLFGGAR